MKNLLKIASVIWLLSACSKDDDRRPGVCYCEFVSGDKQEYDLNHLTRQEQIDACNVHDNNAAFFGGSCELE